MKKAFQYSLSILMAVVVLFSTFSFTVDSHYCGKFLVDKAVFSKAKTCGMDLAVKSDSFSEDPCCSNQKTAVEGQDELKISFHSFDLDQQLFISTFTFAYFNLFEGLPQQIVPFKDYSPPLLVTDIQLVDQVFLI
ncbi:HYC_CC_PP family protein [Salegentibacter chungangensis]|uniref:Secreted protein n=1 Tax=Salegentibacter chungangensis TaxID=1335724 RepID=A0ABW3NP40_9FLAO